MIFSFSSHKFFKLTISARFLLLLAGLPLLPRVSHAQSSTRLLAPGIQYTQELVGGTAPLLINILRIDLNTPGVHVQTGQAQDVISLAGPTKGREEMHSLAIRHNAIAAVNADFFPFTGDPLGLAIRDGELLSEPLGYRAALGIGRQGIQINVLLSVGTLLAPDGATLSLTGINRVPHDGDAIVLTPTYTAMPSIEKNGVAVTLRDVNLPVKLGQTAQGVVESVAPLGSGENVSQTVGHNVQIVMVGNGAAWLSAHCRQGDTLHFRFDVTPNTAPPSRGKYASRADFSRGGRYVPVWTDIEQAVGGGPVLVRNGQIAVDGEAEGFGKADFIDKRHPRTAAGVDAQGNLLLVTVDGRAKWSQGASLAEMAAIMKRLGAVNAMNFDGGGSTTMVIGGSVVNSPSDGRERPVADGLLIYGNPQAASTIPLAGASSATFTTQDLHIAPSDIMGVQVRQDQPFRFQVLDGDNKPIPPQNILWGTGDGFGFMSQQGVFIGSKPGAGTITAIVGTTLLRVPIQVVPTTPTAPKPPTKPVPNGKDPIDPDDLPPL